MIILSLLYSTFILSQNFEMTWQQCYGGSEDEKVRSVISTNNGYLVFGSTSSHDGDVTNNPVNRSAWLLNISNRGDILWDTCYAGVYSYAHGLKIIENNNGYYLIGGTDLDETFRSGFWMARLDSKFKLIWQKYAGGSSIEDPRGGCIAHDGGVIEVGLTGSHDGDIEEYFGVFDNWAVKLKPDGSKDWVKTYANVGAEEGGAIIPTSDGGYILTASGDVYQPGTIYCEDHESLDVEAWLIKIDSLGEIEWNNCYGGTYLDGFMDVIELDDGYVVLGNSTSNDGDLPGHHGTPGEIGDIWVLKTDLTGSIIWSQNYGGNNSDFAKNILLNDDNSFTIFGITRSRNGDVQGNNAPNDERIVWMLKIDENGELIYQKPFDELYQLSDFPDFIRISDYKYIAAVTKRFGGCHGYSNQDIYVFEIQDMDEFIPGQAIGVDRVCLGVETETYYTTTLVVDTMETQWLLEPEEAGIITAMHDSVLINWNIDFHDTAWLQVKSINIYGESSYSLAKEIIVYPPLDLNKISGADSVCVNNQAQSIYTISNPQAYELIWHLNPAEAGSISSHQDTAFISWNSQYTGIIALKTGSPNLCGQEDYSPVKNIKLKNCTGLSEQSYHSLITYPNPAKEFMVFQLPENHLSGHLSISNIYGKTIARLNFQNQEDQVKWVFANIPSGVYFYQTEIEGRYYKGKIIIQK